MCIGSSCHTALAQRDKIVRPNPKNIIGSNGISGNRKGQVSKIQFEIEIQTSEIKAKNIIKNSEVQSLGEDNIWVRILHCKRF